MADLEEHYTRGLRCDACGIEALIPGGMVNRWSKAAEVFKGVCAGNGWQRWISRGTRDYCPNCSPKPGHRMRRLW